MKDIRIPEGYYKLIVYEVFTNGENLVIIGEPTKEHNCDQMGCGSAQTHTIAFADVRLVDHRSAADKEA